MHHNHSSCDHMADMRRHNNMQQQSDSIVPVRYDTAAVQTHPYPGCSLLNSVCGPLLV
jgi:hypothetical protein